MTADEAIAKCRRMHAEIYVETLHADVLERMAIRDPDGEWRVIKCDMAVRLFLGPETKPGEECRTVSRYVWSWRDVDKVIDDLRSKAGGTL